MSDGLGARELQGVALYLVQGAALVEPGVAVPLQPDLHPSVWALALKAVLDRALATVVAEWLLDSRALLEFCVCFGLWRCLWWEGG